MGHKRGGKGRLFVCVCVQGQKYKVLSFFSRQKGCFPLPLPSSCSFSSPLKKKNAGIRCFLFLLLHHFIIRFKATNSALLIHKKDNFFVAVVLRRRKSVGRRRDALRGPCRAPASPPRADVHTNGRSSLFLSLSLSLFLARHVLHFFSGSFLVPSPHRPTTSPATPPAADAAICCCCWS